MSLHLIYAYRAYKSQTFDYLALFNVLFLSLDMDKEDLLSSGTLENKINLNTVNTGRKRERNGSIIAVPALLHHVFLFIG